MFNKIRSRLRNRVTKKDILEELKGIKRELVVTRRALASFGEAFIVKPVLEEKKGDQPSEAQVKSEWFGEDE